MLAAALVCAGAAIAHAQGEDERRLAAELLTMQGDLRRLADPAVAPAWRQGLRHRIAGALSSLPMLMRRAGASAEPAENLAGTWSRGDMAGAAALLDGMTARHRLDLSRVLPADAELAPRGRAIHEEICAGCHAEGADAAKTDEPLPALDLPAFTRSMPAEEFAARLVNGVRGDRLTTLANPFPDRDLAAMLAFYLADRTR